MEAVKEKIYLNFSFDILCTIQQKSYIRNYGLFCKIMP